MPTELSNLEAFKNTNNQDREEQGPTSDTELESVLGAELRSDKDTELEPESGAELVSGKDAELESGKNAELRPCTKSAIIVNRNASRFGRSITKTRKTERLHT